MSNRRNDRGRATEDALDDLHAALARVLQSRVEADPETVSASDLNVARQFLKDNGIEAVRKSGSPLDGLAGTLPDFDEEDEDGPTKR